MTHRHSGHTPARYTLPAAIFTPVAVESRRPAGTFDNARKMLRHPGFWAAMFVVTVLMFAGAVLLAGHLNSTGSYVPADNRPVYYAR